MGSKRFELKATVSSDNLSAVKSAIEEFIGDAGSVSDTEEGLEIKASLEGESAKDLNRELLSRMRRIEKKTRIRSEWSFEGTTERFFDYVSKSTKKN